MAKKARTNLLPTKRKQRPALEASESDGTQTDVVGIVTSAGGLEALSTVLRALPTDFPAAVVISQHLGGQGSQLVTILKRRVSLPVHWAEDGDAIRAGQITVCPSRSTLEILPDGTCSVRKLESIRDRPLDTLLASLANSFGTGAVGVVLTGMGSDGANGAGELKRAGGIVIAQSEESAEHPSMPHAAIRAGVDLVLPLHEIGKVVADIVSGVQLPRSRSELQAVESLFAGPGVARAELRQVDWSSTALGPVAEWPTALRTIIRTVLDNDFPMFVMWGPEQVQIGNDAYAPTLGKKRMQGLPVRTTWPEYWGFVQPQFEQIRRTGESIFAKDAHFSPNRRGFVEEAYFTYCYSPLYDNGQFAGMLETSMETTTSILAERRLATLRALTTAASRAPSATAACERAIGALAENPKDIPFALIYLFDGPQHTANLSACTGVDAGSAVAPRRLIVSNRYGAWPLSSVFKDGVHLEVDDLSARFPAFHTGPWPESPGAAALLPLRPVADEPPVGVLIAGFSARLALDDAYRGFLDVVARQISGSLAEARVLQRERDRVERLGELDRVKTEFFSNVSHEFRTPLTLMLGPLEELLRHRDDLPAPVIADVEIAARNSRRLLSLVDTLLDFSQIEAGKLRAKFDAIDLAELTTGIAAVFRSAVERAGLQFIVDCPELPERVWVDSAMWDKIVSNLLSNAIKFTFEGEIEVRLRALAKHAELVVRDTGVGIPVEEQSQIFKRFHRLHASRARTHEGAGIGLALVWELVRLHHGRVRVQSAPGEGTTFTVWLPLAKRVADDFQESTSAGVGVAKSLAEEAVAWHTRVAERPEDVLGDPLGAPNGDTPSARATGAMVLVAEDNADMRDYLQRLLSPYWRVELAVDGEDALERARLTEPDLILADVMMPRLDGVGLLQAIRSDDSLNRTAVILVTARAGEATAIRGLLAGADDYIAKPFSPRELIARIGGQVELSRLRRRTEELNEFLVRFSDAARSLVDPHAVARTACRMLTEQLRAHVTRWAVIDWSTREYVMEDAYHVEEIAAAYPTLGRFPLDASQPRLSYYLAGQSVVIDDARNDERTPRETAAAMVAKGPFAHIVVPVLLEGQLRATLHVGQTSPRHWEPEEVAFVESVAARCWAEVERARAEAALRQSEERLRSLFDTTSQGVAIMELVRDGAGNVLDARYLELNPAFERLTGVKREVVVGRRSSEVFPLDFAKWQHRLATVKGTGGAERFETFFAETGRWYSFYAAPFGGRDGFVMFFDDVTERKRRERQQEYLLELSDALRPLTDPVEIQSTGARLLGEHLGVTRAMYADVEGEPGSEVGTLRGQYQAAGITLPPFPERYSYDTYGEQVMELRRRGQPMVVTDVTTDARFDAKERAGWIAGGVRAAITVALVKGGRFVGDFGVQSATPREWTPDELALVEETAERTWAAVVRARAEQALRESEERYRRELERSSKK